jgi:Gpi18-like mannosyltransferase
VNIQITDRKHYFFYGGLAIALLIRLVFLLFPYAFWIDMNSFRGWTTGLAQYGIGNFYSSMWSDYPPGYMYVLWLTGKIYQLFDPGLQHTDGALLIAAIKLAPTLADIGGAILIWQILKDRIPLNSAYAASLSYAFNPIIIFVSAVWGQVDGMLIFMMLLVVFLLLQERFIAAGLIGAISLIVKPQGLFLAPLFFGSQWFKQAWWKWITTVTASLAVIWSLVLPFYWQQRNFSSIGAALISPFQFLYQRMMATAATYPYASVNAFNIWGGLNWQPDDLKLFGLSYRLIGLCLLGILLAWIGVFLYRNRQHSAFFLAGAIILLGMFMLPTRMHERYILPAIAFLAITSAFIPTIRSIYWGFTLTSSLNVGYAFVTYNHEELMNAIPNELKHALSAIVVISNLVMFLALIGYTMPARMRSQSQWQDA